MKYLNWEQTVELIVQLWHLPFALLISVAHSDFCLFTALLAFDTLINLIVLSRST